MPVPAAPRRVDVTEHDEKVCAQGWRGPGRRRLSSSRVPLSRPHDWMTLASRTTGCAGFRTPMSGCSPHHPRDPNRSHGTSRTGAPLSCSRHASLRPFHLGPSLAERGTSDRRPRAVHSPGFQQLGESRSGPRPAGREWFRGPAVTACSGPVHSWATLTFVQRSLLRRRR